MTANAQLSRINCAGIIDADDQSERDIANLVALKVAVLPVSEVENLLVLPEVLEAILRLEGHDDASVKRRLDELIDMVITKASDSKNRQSAALRFARRRIDRALKIDLRAARSSLELAELLAEKTSAVRVDEIVGAADRAMGIAIETKDLRALLRWYDDKGLIEVAALAKGTNTPKFKDWLSRALRNDSAPNVVAAIRAYLPAIEIN